MNQPRPPFPHNPVSPPPRQQPPRGPLPPPPPQGPQQPWLGGPGGYQPPGRPPKKKGKLGLVLVLVAIVALVVTAIPVGFYLLGGPSASDDQAGTVAPQGGKPPFNANTPLNAATLNSVDSAALFWEMFFRQSQQPVVETKSEFFQTPEAAAMRSAVQVSHSAVDYRSKQFSDDEITVYSGDPPEMSGRCVNGTKHRWSAPLNSWQPPTGFATPCTLEASGGNAGDQIIPGGLNPQQATAMITHLTGKFHGFVHVGQAQWAELNGKSAIRLPVEFRVLPSNNEWGMTMLAWAAADAGVNPQTHPFQQGDGPGEGARAVYYVDPQSLLPIYHYREQTAPMTNGQPSSEPRPVRRVEYVQPSTVRTDPLGAPEPVTLSVPPTVK